MEIERNSRDAKVAFPLANASEMVKVRMESSSGLFEYHFASGVPTAEESETKWIIDIETGELHHAGESRGVKYDSSENAVTVPLEIIRYCGKFDVEWTYSVEGEEYVESQQVTVIQSLFTAKELREFDPDFENIPDSAIKRLERIVRAVIERATGQKFELTYGTETARSHNGGTLVLPKRAVALDGHQGYVLGVRTRLESDGWIVRALSPYRSFSVIGTNPIYDVHTVTAFREGSYPINGEWGYRSVPEQINLCAMLLAQEYGCRESVWRDRYIESIKNVDWNVKFHDSSFAGTGHIKVDQILQAYTLNKMVVI